MWFWSDFTCPVTALIRSRGALLLCPARREFHCTLDWPLVKANAVALIEITFDIVTICSFGH
jgi:hypothetical protein